MCFTSKNYFQLLVIIHSQTEGVSSYVKQQTCPIITSFLFSWPLRKEQTTTAAYWNQYVLLRHATSITNAVFSGNSFIRYGGDHHSQSHILFDSIQIHYSMQWRKNRSPQYNEQKTKQNKRLKAETSFEMMPLVKRGRHIKWGRNSFSFGKKEYEKFENLCEISECY